MKVFIQYQDQFGYWKSYQMMHNQANAFRTAKQRAKTTGKRHRLVDESGNLLDSVEP